MNLLFLYGPPATGKLTVAKQLSALTGYSLFHNHLTRDLVQDIYPGKVSDHYDLVRILRDNILSYCAAHGTSLIFTFVYDGPEDDEAVSRLVQNVTEHDGKVIFIELTAPAEVLIERVSNESRKDHKKLIDPEILAALLNTKTYSSVPFENILKIDTSKLSPNESAQTILSHFNLPQATE